MQAQTVLSQALVAYAHFASILLLAGVLTAELALYRQDLTVGQARLLQRVDLYYLIAALLVLATGLSRLLGFARETAYYLDNPVFWIKMGLFLTVALVSVVPTIHYLRWSPRLRQGHRPEISDRQYVLIRRYLWVEVLLVLLIPLTAVLMARGIGM
jgi:putative membrane protein